MSVCVYAFSCVNCDFLSKQESILNLWQMKRFYPILRDRFTFSCVLGRDWMLLVLRDMLIQPKDICSISSVHRKGYVVK